MHTWWLPVALVGFIIGVLSATIEIQNVVWIGIGILVIMAGIFVTKKFPNWAGLFWKLYLVLVVFVCVAVLRTAIIKNNLQAPELDWLVGQVVEVEGTVAGEVDRRYDKNFATIEITKIMRNEYQWQGRVRIRVSLPKESIIEINDVVQLNGRLQTPEKFYTDTGREFDYQNYLAAKKVGYIMSYPTLENFGHTEISFRERLINMKYKLLSVANRHLPPAEAGLVGGVLLGDQSGLPEPLQNNFRRVGIIHIVVLSGYNVMLVAEALRKGIGRINKRAGWIAALVGVLLFAVITGLQVTVVRATIMAIVLLIAQSLKRPYVATRGLLLAMLVMMWISPYIIFADLGFQLSVTATLGIIYLVPIVERWFQWVAEQFGIREITTVTIATQLAVLPLLIYSVGQVSLVSPIVNVLVIIFVPLAMAVGALMVAAGVVWSGLAVVLSPVVYGIFHYIVWISELIGAWKFAAIQIPPLPGWVVAGLYLVLVVWIIRYERQRTNALVATN